MLFREEILSDVDVFPRDEPRLQHQVPGGTHRFMNKLSHYLHADIETLSHRYGVHPVAILKARQRTDTITPRCAAQCVRQVLSLIIGTIVGRWDMRVLLGERKPCARDDPFAALPLCQPAALQDESGVPARSAPPKYPMRIDWDGILTDDAEHQDDIVGRVRSVIEMIWNEQAEVIEKEACGILGVKDLESTFGSLAKGDSGTTTSRVTPRADGTRRSTGCSNHQERTTLSGCTTTDSTRTSCLRHW